MSKFIAFMSVVALFASAYVFHRIDHMVLMSPSPYSAENVARVRANIPVEQPRYTPPTIEVVVPQHQVECLQANIYFETRNQSKVGKIGTAWVTLNRVNHDNFDDTICDVVYAASLDHRGIPIRHKCQFLWYCDGKSDRPNLNNKFERKAWEESGQIAYTMVRSCVLGVEPERCPDDPTNGGLFFRSGKTQLGDNDYYVQTAVIEAHTYFAINE